MQVPSKAKNRTTTWPSNPTPGYLPGVNCHSKGYMDPNFHCSTICDSQNMESPSMSIGKRMDKEDMVHIYNGILLSHKKERNYAICRGVDGPRDSHTE